MPFGKPSKVMVFLANRWHVGCGAMGVWARHRRFAHNGAERNDLNLVGARGRDVPTSGGRVRRGPSPGGWWAGVRPAACPERQRRTDLGAGAGCLRRFETLERSGPAFARLRRGKDGSAGRWSGSSTARRESRPTGRLSPSPSPARWLREPQGLRRRWSAASFFPLPRCWKRG